LEPSTVKRRGTTRHTRVSRGLVCLLFVARRRSAEPPACRCGGLARLSARNLDHARVEIVRQSLTSDDPLVRAVAARIAGTHGVTSLRNAIATAFRAREHPAVAAEQVRALLTSEVRPRPWRSFPASTTQVPGRILAFLDWSARMQTGAVPDRLPRFAPLMGRRYQGGCCRRVGRAGACTSHGRTAPRGVATGGDTGMGRLPGSESVRDLRPRRRGHARGDRRGRTAGVRGGGALPLRTPVRPCWSAAATSPSAGPREAS
jgi:hypothetical protein